MSLDVTQEERGEVRVFALNGRLDGDSGASLQIAVDESLAAGAQHFVLDLSGLGYLSSAGLKVLSDFAVRAKAAGSLRLCCIPSAVREVLTAEGMLGQFSVYPDRNAALASHPQARVDPDLARAAAGLMGTTPSAGGAKVSPDVARAAADLLGAGAPPPAKPAPGPMKRAAKSKPEPEEGPGLVDRLRKIFSKKD